MKFDLVTRRFEMHTEITYFLVFF